MIYEKLAKIQSELFVPKGNRNDFGKYNYRSCEDILKAVKPLCEKNKCVLYMTNEMQEIGGRVYVKAVCTLVDTENGEQIQSVAHAREEENKKGMDGSQITGTSSSYARKYALAGLFCIDNEKDSDATNTHEDKNEIPKEEKKQITKKEADILGKMLSDDQKAWVVDNYHVNTLAELTGEQYGKIMQTLNERREHGA